MSSYLELLLPPIVVGVLILMIVSLNHRMMESQVDARLTSEMQQYANAALSAIQEEVRSVQVLGTVSETEISFVSTANESVRIYRNGRDLLVMKQPLPQGAAKTTAYPARLSDIRFGIVEVDSSGPTLLRVYVESESTTGEKVASSPFRQRAYAQRDFYLRNID